jgi:ABC-type transport system substrate-binding protein
LNLNLPQSIIPVCGQYDAIITRCQVIRKTNDVKKKNLITLTLMITVGLVVSTCQSPEPQTIIRTVVVEKEGETVIETVVVTVEPTEEPEEENEVVQCCDVYRVGIYEEPVSFNYWNYLGPGTSVWTRYVIANDAAHLFDISDRTFQFVPSLAKDIPEPIENDDGTWLITVEMVDDALWSDGEPITANDVVFTHSVCKDLELTWYWPTFCTPDGVEVVAEALDDFTVQYTYLNQAPNLMNWQFGIAMAPILPSHYWSEITDPAFELIEENPHPVSDRPEDCVSSGLSTEVLELCEIWFTYDNAFERARNILYDADPVDQPVAGGFVLQDWIAGDEITLIANKNYYFTGAEIVEFEDGTWKRIMPGGNEIMFFGGAQGDEILRFRDGPYNPQITYAIYGSQEAAFGALAAGEVDYVLNPIGIPREIRDQMEAQEDIKTFVNPDYNMFYLAFNMRKYPMSEYEFRQVFDIIIDKELIIEDVLGEMVLPMYSTMPASNRFWHNPDVPKDYLGLSRAERIDLAVQTLKGAGWRWSSEPFWDEVDQHVVPGEGLIMPNGDLMPEFTILGPGQDFDIVRATFNQWVSEWARELGMPVQSELTGRNAILDSVFVASDYDMYIFGSPLGNPAYPVYYDEFWHSRNCTFETGGRNTPCFKDEAYDSLVDAFNLTGDLNSAKELVYEMQLILADQRPFIPLYSEKVFDFARENLVFPYLDSLGGIEFNNGFRTSTQVLLEE